MLTPSSYCSAPAHSSLQSISISLQANLQIARANSGGEHLPSSSGCLHRAGHPAGSSVCRPQGSPARFWEPTSPCPIPALCGGRSARPSMLVTGQQAPWVLAGHLVTLSSWTCPGPLVQKARAQGPNSLRTGVRSPRCPQGQTFLPSLSPPSTAHSLLGLYVQRPKKDSPLHCGRAALGRSGGPSGDSTGEEQDSP